MGKRTISTVATKPYLNEQRTFSNEHYSKQTQTNPIPPVQSLPANLISAFSHLLMHPYTHSLSVFSASSAIRELQSGYGVFGELDDLVHHQDRFVWESSDRRFSRKHHKIRPVDDGVGHSVTSARVGRGCSVMCSNICVAVITNFFAALHFLIMCF